MRHSPFKSRSGGSTGKRTPTIISPTTQCSKVDLFLGPIIINQKVPIHIMTTIQYRPNKVKRKKKLKGKREGERERVGEVIFV